MSDQRPRYASTGAELPPLAEQVTPDDVLRLRRASLDTEGNRTREAIAERIERERETSATRGHDEAVANIDYAYRDVVSNPVLLNEFVAERQRRINQAQAERRLIDDWDSEYRDIGETIRKKAGLPSGEQRERAEVLEELRKARGQ